MVADGYTARHQPKICLLTDVHMATHGLVLGLLEQILGPQAGLRLELGELGAARVAAAAAMRASGLAGKAEEQRLEVRGEHRLLGLLVAIQWRLGPRRKNRFPSAERHTKRKSRSVCSNVTVPPPGLRNKGNTKNSGGT